MGPHTFLRTPGTWVASGSYRQADGVTVPCHGRTRVRHEPRRWTIEGELTVGAEDPTTYRNDYVLDVVPDGATTARFTSANPDLGDAAGLFVFVGDAILSTATVGELTALETMHRVDADRYEARGALVAGAEPLGTWEVTLDRALDAE